MPHHYLLNHSRRASAPLTVACFFLLSLFCAAAPAHTAELVSQVQNAPIVSESPWIDPAGTAPPAFFSTISKNGRYVVFLSTAANLMPGQQQRSFGFYRYDQNVDASDLFLGHANAWITSLRFINNDQALFFTSRASNLLDPTSTEPPHDDNRSYVYSPDTNRIVAFDPQGLLDGKEVVYADDGIGAAFAVEDSNGTYSVSVYSRTKSKLRTAAAGSNRKVTPTHFSGDGRFLLLSTLATNLNLADTDDEASTYLLDTEDLSIQLIGNDLQGYVRPDWINHNGSKVLLRTSSENFIHEDQSLTPWLWMLLDRATGSYERVPIKTFVQDPMSGAPYFPFLLDMSEDTRYLSLYRDRIQGRYSGITYNIYDRLENKAIHVTKGIDSRTVRHNADRPNISSDGRYVAFSSSARGVVDGSFRGLYLFDRVTGKYSWVSKRNGQPMRYSGDGASHSPVISEDGGVVAFASMSFTIVPNMKNIFQGQFEDEWGLYHRAQHVFVRDRHDAATETVTGNLADTNFPFGSRPGFMSAGGRYITFLGERGSRANQRGGYYDRATGILERVFSESSREPPITPVLPPFDAQERWFVFATKSEELVAASENNGDLYWQVVLKNLQNGEFQNITSGANGDSMSPTIDPGGRFVIFRSFATNLVDSEGDSVSNEARLYLHDLDTESTELLLPFDPSVPLGYQGTVALMGSDPNRVLYSEKENRGPGYCRIYNRETNTDRPLIAGWTHSCDRPVPSYDGNRVAFYAPSNALESDTASDSTALFVYDQSLDRVAKVPDSTGVGIWPALSGDGQTIAFVSNREDLDVPNDGNDKSDVFVVPVDPLFRTGNRAPLAIGQNLTTPQDEAVVVFLTGRDDDADPITFQTLSSPNHGQLTGEPPNLVYTPETGFNGEDLFTFALDDGIAQSQPATVRILVGDTVTETCDSDCLPPLAAVLPSSRSVPVNSTATVFATMINPSPTITARACHIELDSPLAIDFQYRSSDPTTNSVAGEADSAFDVAPTEFASFVLSLTPTESFTLTEIAFVFNCENTGTAPVIMGLNTLQLASSAEPVADVVAIALTPTADGIARMGVEEFGAYVVATSNLGAAAEITAAPATAPWFNGETLICETNTATGACLAAATASITTTMRANSTHSFALFVRSNEPITLDPARYRQVIEFTDSSGARRGSTSVALATQP